MKNSNITSVTNASAGNISKVKDATLLIAKTQERLDWFFAELKDYQPRLLSQQYPARA